MSELSDRGEPSRPSRASRGAGASSSASATAPGKVNLHFRVGPVQADGYHPVASLYAAVDLLETVEVDVDPDVPAGQVRCELTVVPGSLVDQQARRGAFDPGCVPLDERNLAVRAALAVLADSPPLDGGLRLRIAKAVPVAGGMGGGSADAAAALRATAQLVARRTGREIPPEALLRIGAGLGADVPFALTGGAAVGTGTGTRLRPVPVGAPWPAVLIADEGALSTPAVFQRLDALRDQGRVPSRAAGDLAVPPELIDALAAGDVVGGARWAANDLQAAAVDLRPALGELIRELEGLGARAMISGSGPTILALPGLRNASPDGPRRAPSQSPAVSTAARELEDVLRGHRLCCASVLIG